MSPSRASPDRVLHGYACRAPAVSATSAHRGATRCRPSSTRWAPRARRKPARWARSPAVINARSWTRWRRSVSGNSTCPHPAARLAGHARRPPGRVAGAVTRQPLVVPDRLTRPARAERHAPMRTIDLLPPEAALPLDSRRDAARRMNRARSFSPPCSPRGCHAYTHVDAPCTLRRSRHRPDARGPVDGPAAVDLTHLGENRGHRATSSGAPATSSAATSCS
jgi:hypothetical protein